MNDWYESLRGLQSLGSQVASPGSLAGLHEARRKHMGQFFTPDAIAAFMWKLVEKEVDLLVDTERGYKPSIVDTSVGSGRLLQFCSPDKHIVGGMDIDPVALSQVQEVFERAGFECHFENCGMEVASVNRWSLALINPPFTVHLESPLLDKYQCTTYGKFGPNTSAQSDYYALSQALEAASGVVALVPRTVAEKVWSDPGLVDIEALVHHESKDPSKSKSRLHARFDLPTDSFKDEGAVVEVSVLVFGYSKLLLTHRTMKSISSLGSVESTGDLGLCRFSGDPRLKPKGLEDTGPTITIAVTGDNEVRVAHDRSKLKLKFKCGFTQARVMNAILDRRIHSTKDHRLPDGYKYAGQGKLDLQVHLLQDDPEASLKRLLAFIEAQEAKVIVDQGLWPYFRKLMRRNALAAAPMGHTVWKKTIQTQNVVARCKKVVIVDKSSWSSPVINVGEEVEFTKSEDGKFTAILGEHRYEVNFEELNEHFEGASAGAESGWVDVHAPLQSRSPEVARWWQARVENSEVKNWLTWDFQRADLIELLMSPRGAVVAWSMGLGKSRLACALILLSGVKHGLVTTEAYLVPEFVEQLEKLGLPQSWWKVIKCEADLNDLRRINIISNERLRLPLKQAEAEESDLQDEGAAKTEKATKRQLTYAHKLRRRVKMVVSDEGEFLSNPTSAQSRALWRVSGQKRYVLSGTPIANYPRDVLPILCYVAGDGTAAQPWGYRGPYLEANHINSVEFADRGVKRFTDEYIVLEWVTNEFSDSLRDGAKREIPRISNLAAYRAMLAPHIKRRVVEEPEVARYVTIPKPRTVMHSIAWDEEHLGHYLRVADEFSEWMGREQTKKKNLLVILLRFQAVLRALNMPQSPAKHVRSVYSGVTSKQRFLVDRMEELANAGEKTICYVHSPDLAMLLAKRLAVQAGVEPVVLHGGVTAAKRHKMLNDGFKKGSCPTLISTYGVTQAGLNIPQATRVLMGSRDWTAKVERQSIARALRPETKHEVTVEYVHIAGSADDYQGRMVDFKADCIDSGLDWAAPAMDDVEFLHLDTILGRFVEDLAGRRGMKVQDLKDMLKVSA